jgi:hypothetical protein
MITKKPRAPKLTETQVHLQVAAYCKKVGFNHHALAIHLRNERASAGERMTATKFGVLSGLPDWCFIYAGHTGFIELKPAGFKARRAKTGKFTAHELRQIAVHDRLRLAGCWVEICESLDEVLARLKEHGVPVRTSSLTEERIVTGFKKAMEEETENA